MDRLFFRHITERVGNHNNRSKEEAVKKKRQYNEKQKKKKKKIQTSFKKHIAGRVQMRSHIRNREIGRLWNHNWGKDGAMVLPKSYKSRPGSSRSC